MERLANIIDGLRTMILDCGDNIKVSLEFQIDISGNNMSVSTPSSSMPCLEEENEVFEPCSLINFLNNELKEEFEEGRIGNILEAVKKYSQRNASENQSTMPGFSMRSVSPGEREALAYSSRYNFEFDELEKLGEGRHGHVFKCRHKVENAICTVKKIAFNDKHHNFVLREARAMARLDHWNIVRCAIIRYLQINAATRSSQREAFRYEHGRSEFCASGRCKTGDYPSKIFKCP